MVVLLMSCVYISRQWQQYFSFSPDVKDGDHSISFGTPAKAREDLLSDEVGDKLWSWLDKETDPYV